MQYQVGLLYGSLGMFLFESKRPVPIRSCWGLDFTSKESKSTKTIGVYGCSTS